MDGNVMSKEIKNTNNITLHNEIRKPGFSSLVMVLFRGIQENGPIEFSIYNNILRIALQYDYQQLINFINNLLPTSPLSVFLKRRRE